MSIPEGTGFKKQECGDMHHIEQMIRDCLGGIIDFQIAGTDPHVGVIIGSTMASDYAPPAGHKNPDGTFFICIETEGTFHIRLADGSEFVITTVQSTAYLGQWYPAKLIEVIIGGTGNFSVGY